MQKQVIEIINKLVDEINNDGTFEEEVTFNDVKHVVESQFHFVKRMMASGVRGEYKTFPNILLKYLGTFYASEGKCKYITKNYNKKHEVKEEKE